MVDELDPRLEAALRTVLRDEANAIPFTLQAAALNRVRSERFRTRRLQRWSAAAAALAVIVVGGGALAMALRPSGSASPPGDSLSGLPSFDRLAEAVTGGGTTILRLEDVVGSQAHQGQYGLPSSAYAFQYLVACSGSGPLIVSLAAESGPAIKLGTVTCDGGVWRLEWDGTDEQAILSATSVSLVVQGQPGSAWRMLVADDGSGRIVQHFGASPSLFRLPSMDYLVQQRSAGATELARGSGLNEAASGTSVSTLRRVETASAIEIFLACVGSQVELSLISASSATAASGPTPITCDGTRQSILWARSDATHNVSEVRLAVPAGTAWEAIVWDISADPGRAAPPHGTTSP